jgi:hypothetical protein
MPGDEQGAFSVSTVMGQPLTVLSDLEEEGGTSRVDAMAGRDSNGNYQSTPTKKFKIFVVPELDEGFEAFCFQFIGQGASFCTARNCVTAHHHASVKTVKPGELYVAKSYSTAFVTPSITKSVVEVEVLVSWQALSLALPEWNQMFFIATAASDDAPASSAALEVQQAFFRDKAMTYKTPAKRKRSNDENEGPADLLDIVPYSPLFRNDEDVPLTEFDQISAILARLDQGVVSNNETLMNFVNDYRFEHAKAGEAFGSLWLRLEALSASLGTSPARLAVDYMAPSAWASIGAIATRLDELGVHQISHQTQLEDLKLEINVSIGNQLSVSQDEARARLSDFKRAFIEAIRGLGGRLDSAELQIISLVAKLSNRGSEVVHIPTRETDLDRLSRNLTIDLAGPTTPNPSTELASDEFATRVEARLVKLETKLSGLIAKSDDRAIMFAGLGFKSIGESNAWLETEMRRHPSGLIVDVHMVFEHIHNALEGIDTIATMEKLYKIKVSCIADSVAMTSFDAKAPKFFCKVQGHKVIKGDTSYFDRIPTHAEWSDAGSGFKMRLQETLAEFQEAHSTFIDQAVEIGSRPHTLAHAALTESGAWIIGFTQFIDEYYRELSKAKFGSAKAWHVTTRLAKRILDEIGTQRYGVQNAFAVGDSRQICQQIVWAVLKSHDVMAEYKRLNFKNHPSIATELVKFLAINTSFEAIEKLTVQVACHAVELCEAKKHAAAAVKAASSAGNKADEVKKLNDQLIKRIAKLEARA